MVEDRASKHTNHIQLSFLLVFDDYLFYSIAKNQNFIVGLDFGNNYTRVGVWERNHIEIISNELGSRITPSCVAFTDTGRSIGNEAKNKMATNPYNTVYNVKRLIGRQFDDQEIQLNMKVPSCDMYRYT